MNAKAVVHVAVTRAPTEQWTAQQLREATPFGQGPQLLVRDRDAKYGTVLDRVAEGADITVLPTAPCSPRMNSVVERFIGGARRGCLDPILILSEDHLRFVLSEYVAHFNSQRAHQGIQQRIPKAKGSQPSSNGAGNLVAFPVLNGLHHHDQRVA